jgi:hypothetical protein
MPKAKRVCAWCDKFLGMTGADTYREGAITHGICDSCLCDMRKKTQPKNEPETQNHNPEVPTRA